MAYALDDPDELLTTGAVALLLGSSRQHVVDLCQRGSLPCESVGTHRRIRARDVLKFQHVGERDGPTKEALRSLWLHTAVAGKVVADPDRTIKIARRNLASLLAAHPRGEAARQLRRWERLLAGPIDDVVEMLMCRAPYAVDLRQNSPFAGVLTDRERHRVLRSFAESHRRR